MTRSLVWLRRPRALVRWAALSVLAVILGWSGGGERTLAVAPSFNGLIAFETNRDGDFEVYTMNADGSDPTNLTGHPADDFDPTWSPDGTKIAFASNRDGNGEIYVMNADGSGQTRLTTNPFHDTQPAWSPNGSQIVFTTTRHGYNELYVMNANGSGETRLTTNGALDIDPAWSPDGTTIAFTRVIVFLFGGSPDLYRMDPDGTNQAYLTSFGANLQPAWSPDGARLAFTRAANLQSDTDLFAMNVGGGGETQLTFAQGLDVDADWSPDGAKIVFATTRDDPNYAACRSSCNSEVYVIGADGSTPVRLTDNPAFDSDPDWQAVESAPPPRMRKLPPLQNLFLTRQGTKIRPTRCVDGTNAATLTESINVPITSADPKDPAQPQQLGGFSFQVRYDPLKVCVALRPGPAWTVNPQQVCTIQDSVTAPTLQGIARINCVTLGKATVVDTSTAAGRTLALIEVRPQPEAYSQIKANQGNGQTVQLNNEACKLTDLQGHAIQVFSCEDADVTIRFLEGDVEPDCQVNTLDTQAIAFRWGATKGTQIYNSRFNLEPSGTQADQDIDVNDLQFVYGRFGSTCLAPHPPQVPVNPKG